MAKTHLQKLNRMTTLQRELNTKTMTNEKRDKLAKELNTLGKSMFAYKRK